MSLASRIAVLAAVSAILAGWAGVAAGKPAKPTTQRAKTQPAATRAAASEPAGLKVHRQQVSDSPRQYVLRMGGTVDGLNTRGPVGYRVFDQTFEPNVEVSITNTGTDVVKNPRLRIDGRGGWRNIQEMVAELAAGLKTDAEKARAAFEFERKHRFHCSSYDAEVRDAVKALNGYGYTLCFDDSKCLAQLWQAMGLQTRRGWPYGHSVTEVLYDDAWHMMDGDEHCIYLLRDNRAIAGEEQFVQDPDLVKRTHSYGPLQRDSRMTDEGGAGLFYYDGPRDGSWPETSSHTMDFDLRPSEKIAWRWEYTGRYHGFEDIGMWPGANTRICNGYLEYAPNMDDPDHKKRLVLAELPIENGAKQLVTVPVKSAWPIVGGWLEVKANKPAVLKQVMILKNRGQEAVSIWQGQENVGDGEPIRVDLDSQFPPSSPACYEYLLQFIVVRDNNACDCPEQPDPTKAFTLHNTLQMAWLSMPSLACGENHVSYADDSQSRQVRIEHKWLERDDSAPPAAPPAPRHPKDGATVSGTKFTFEWEPPADGQKIADYWFELSDRADMRWPLSPNFEKLIGKTRQAGTASYEVPYEGLLNPGQTYYWRVRARSEKGVWGPWSQVWSFAAKAPAPPVNVKMDWNKDKRALTLRWEENPQGDRPARYVLYGSDEKGFTASDEAYEVNVGTEAGKTFPANRIAETRETSYVIFAGTSQPSGTQPATLQPAASQPATGIDAKMFYRVVAVAADGTRSGPSDYARAQGPIIITAAPAKIPYGPPTVIPMKALASAGNLRSRALEGKSYQAEFGLNADELRWSIHSDVHAEIDPKTGVVRIQPSIWDLGPAEFIVICRNQRGEQDAYRFTVEVVAGNQ